MGLGGGTKVSPLGSPLQSRYFLPLPAIFATVILLILIGTAITLPLKSIMVYEKEHFLNVA
jgi:hypothetical protein